VIRGLEHQRIRPLGLWRTVGREKRFSGLLFGLADW